MIIHFIALFGVFLVAASYGSIATNSVDQASSHLAKDNTQQLKSPLNNEKASTFQNNVRRKRGYTFTDEDSNYLYGLRGKRLMSGQSDSYLDYNNAKENIDDSIINSKTDTPGPEILFLGTGTTLSPLGIFTEDFNNDRLANKRGSLDSNALYAMRGKRLPSGKKNIFELAEYLDKRHQLVPDSLYAMRGKRVPPGYYPLRGKRELQSRIRSLINLINNRLARDQ